MPWLDWAGSALSWECFGGAGLRCVQQQARPVQIQVTTTCVYHV